MQVAHDSRRYLTPRELHERLRRQISTRTLANWRYLGIGPRYTKAGGRVLYPLDEIEAWERANTVQSTSNYVANG